MNPEQQLSTGRVTAGLPALDPSVRFFTDSKERQDHKIKSVHETVAKRRDDAVRPDGDRDTTDLRAAIGSPLHSSVIIKRLNELNPNLSFRHHPWLPRFLIFRNDHSDEYICAFEDGYSPEFEVLHWHWEEQAVGYGRDAHLEKVKVLDSTTRGWVPLLRRLISGKHITRAGAERLFGLVYSKGWHDALAGY